MLYVSVVWKVTLKTCPAICQALCCI